MKKLLAYIVLLFCLIGESSEMAKIQLGDDPQTVKNRMRKPVVEEVAGRITFSDNPDFPGCATTCYFGNGVYRIDVSIGKGDIVEIMEKLKDVKDWKILIEKGVLTLIDPKMVIKKSEKKKESIFGKKGTL